jgi:hypothetical protein
MTGRHRPALQLLYASLRAAIRLRSRYTGALHASICQALVEIGRPRPARRHGERALRLARARREAEGERIALMLLAQAHAQLGSAEAAQAALDELQERHYPGVPGLAAFFTALGPARWANLRG